MSKIYLFLTAGIALFLAAIFLFLVLSVRNRLDSYREQDHFIEIKNYVEGEFIPQNNNTNIIVLTFKNPGLNSHEMFKFLLKDGMETVRSIEFSGDNLGDPADLRFQFEPIMQSKGRQFTIRVEREKEGPKVAVAVDKKNNLSFTTFYRVENRMFSIRSLAERWINFPTGDLVFFVIWVGLLALVAWRGVGKV